MSIKNMATLEALQNRVIQVSTLDVNTVFTGGVYAFKAFVLDGVAYQQSGILRVDAGQIVIQYLEYGDQHLKRMSEDGTTWKKWSECDDSDDVIYF